MKRIFNPVKRKKVLIVDEDQNLASIYRDQLRTQGFEIEVAGNNKEVRERFGNDYADLVVLDLSMPGTEGVEILEKIRSDAQTRTLPIIALCNPFLSHLTRAAREAGATKCVTKAECTRRDFVQVVREAFAVGQAGAVETSSGVTNGIAAFDLPSKLDTTFLASALETLATLRISHYAFAKTEQEDFRRVELCEMRRLVHFLAGLAGLSGFHKAAQLASALEALFIDLHAKPKNIKPSVIRTIAQAVDRLGSLLDHTCSQTKPATASKVLVVDDEIIARKTISSAMAKAGFAVEGPENSAEALHLLEKNRFDLIFLDVEMPGLDGMELCARTRKTVANHATPIVFVTAHSDFEIRAQSILSGGNDFIAKPFISVELAVKALTCLFRENRRPRPAAKTKIHSSVEDEYSESAHSTDWATVGLAGSFA